MMSITPTQHDHNLDAVRGVLILSAGSCSAIWMLRQMLFFFFFLPYYAILRFRHIILGHLVVVSQLFMTISDIDLD